MLKLWIFTGLIICCNLSKSQSFPSRSDVSNFFGRFYPEFGIFRDSPQVSAVVEPEEAANEETRSLRINVSASEQLATAIDNAQKSSNLFSSLGQALPLLSVNFDDKAKSTTTTTTTTTKKPLLDETVIDQVSKLLPEILELLKQLISLAGNLPATAPASTNQASENMPTRLIAQNTAPSFYNNIPMGQYIRGGNPPMPMDMYDQKQSIAVDPQMLRLITALQAGGRLPELLETVTASPYVSQRPTSVDVLKQISALQSSGRLPELLESVTASPYIRQGPAASDVLKQMQETQLLEKLLRLRLESSLSNYETASTTTTTPAPVQIPRITVASAQNYPWFPFQLVPQELLAVTRDSGTRVKLIVDNESAHRNDDEEEEERWNGSN